MLYCSQNVCQNNLNYSNELNINMSFLNDSTNDTQIYKELINAMDMNLTLEENCIINDSSSHCLMENLVKSNQRAINPDLYEKLAGNFTNFVRSSRGSHFLQLAMFNTDVTIISKIFHEIKNNLPTHLLDTYSNYFCKYLYPLLPLNDRLEFLEAIRFSFTSIAKDNKGTYALQYIVERLNSDEEFKIISDIIQLYATFSNLIEEKNSIHVLEKIILKVPEESYLNKTFEYIFSKFKIFCRNKIRMRLILAMLKRDLSNSKRKKVLYLIIQNFESLINEKVGYYIVYFILEVIYYLILELESKIYSFHIPSVYGKIR